MSEPEARLAAAVNVQLADLRDKWNAAEAKLSKAQFKIVSLESDVRSLRLQLAAAKGKA